MSDAAQIDPPAAAEHTPYVAAETTLAELTPKAIILGMI